MNLLKKLKNIFIKPIQVNSTTLSKINTDLIKVPNFNNLSDNDKEKVLEYIKEIDISNLESVIKYASDLNEKANANVEILMRLYYRLVDERELKLNTGNIIYDKYNTLININELNLCKNELLNLRKNGILRVVALEEVLKKENSRKLFFSSIFGKYERLKRKTELNSLIDSIERTKVVIKVIEQLIQTVNINVSSEILKVSAENTLFSITKKEDAHIIIGNIINETKSLINTFLPEYENNFTFNINNINECIVELSVAKRLLDLYAYKHKDEAPSIIKDIDEIYFEYYHYFSYNTIKEKIQKKLDFIENKYKLFEGYLKTNIFLKDALHKFYMLKFRFLTCNLEKQDKSPFTNIHNKELIFYENIISNEIEKILKGNIIIFNPKIMNISNQKKKEIITMIKEMLINKSNDFDLHRVLMDKNCLLLIKTLSETFYSERDERIEMLNNITLPKLIGHANIKDSKNYFQFKYTIKILKFLIELYYLYRKYPYIDELNDFYFPKVTSDLEFLSKNDSKKAELFKDIIKNNKLCILTQDPGKTVLINSTDLFFNNLKIETLVLSPDTVFIEISFNNCKNLQVIDATLLDSKKPIIIDDSFNNCPNLKYIIVTKKQLQDGSIINKVLKKLNFNKTDDAVLILKGTSTYYVNINYILKTGISTKDIDLYIEKYRLRTYHIRHILTDKEFLKYLEYKNVSFDNKYSIGVDWKNNHTLYTYIYNKMYTKKCDAPTFFYIMYIKKKGLFYLYD